MRKNNNYKLNSMIMSFTYVLIFALKHDLIQTSVNSCIRKPSIPFKISRFYGNTVQTIGPSTASSYRASVRVYRASVRAYRASQ